MKVEVCDLKCKILPRSLQIGKYEKYGNGILLYLHPIVLSVCACMHIFGIMVFSEEELRKSG